MTILSVITTEVQKFYNFNNIITKKAPKGINKYYYQISYDFISTINNKKEMIVNKINKTGYFFYGQTIKFALL